MLVIVPSCGQKDSPDRVLRIDEPIDDGVSAQIAQEFAEFAVQNSTPVMLEVNSPGGKVLATLALIREIKASSISIHSHSTDGAGGLSNFVLAAAEEGQRSCDSGALFHFPEIWSDLSPDVMDKVKWGVRIQLLDVFGENSSPMIDVLFSGRVLSAEEAKALGFIDRIDTPKQSGS